MTSEQFQTHVKEQIALLNEGKPLEAFDRYFASDGIMFANGLVFATGAKACREKQEPYIASARSIDGRILDLVISPEKSVCAFRNRTSFTTHEGKTFQIDGVCWQRWQDDKIIEEHYFEGEEMHKMIHRGILKSPQNFV
ncbi:MAG TPA: hypothetical protein DCS30_19815 [Rhizobiales bacterium]|nr:hypothetical protein [Hyphomicrobiales bacterium]